jgi:uncharacterized YccA/Bax inhibitor family protein
VWVRPPPGAQAQPHKKGEKQVMQSSNPVLNRSFKNPGYAAVDPNKLEEIYNAPAASSARTGRMTMDDVITRTGILLAVLVVAGGISWTLNLGGGIIIIALLAGFGLAMVNTFSKTIRPGLILTYAAVQGVALGAISHSLNIAYPGIAGQAVMGTICAFVGMLVAYRSGRIRVTPKFTKMLIGAAMGYLLLGLVSIVGSFAGLGGGLGLFGISGFGPLIAIAGVALASFFLILDFDQIQKGVAANLPEQESWRAAFGLMVTIVWLYMEILRLLSILRGRD